MTLLTESEIVEAAGYKKDSDNFDKHVQNIAVVRNPGSQGNKDVRKVRE